MITFNSELTIDGLFTGLAAFGALTGYITNLIVRYRSNMRQEREKADKLTIMEILEYDLMNGYKLDEIEHRFKIDKLKEFRKSVGVSEPSKLKKVDFSKYLRDLQMNNMIEQVGVDKFKLKVYPITKISY
jgi:hypothetical protein